MVGWLGNWLEGRRLRDWVGGGKGRGGEDGYIREGGRETGLVEVEAVSFSCDFVGCRCEMRTYDTV